MRTMGLGGSTKWGSVACRLRFHYHDRTLGFLLSLNGRCGHHQHMFYLPTQRCLHLRSRSFAVTTSRENKHVRAVLLKARQLTRIASSCFSVDLIGKICIVIVMVIIPVSFAGNSVWSRRRPPSAPRHDSPVVGLQTFANRYCSRIYTTVLFLSPCETVQ